MNARISTKNFRAAPTTLPTDSVQSGGRGTPSKPYRPPHSCSGCTERWSGENTCHCTACHGTWAGVDGFDQHRVNFECVDPATVTITKGPRKGAAKWQRVQRPGHMLWTSTAESPEWWTEQ